MVTNGLNSTAFFFFHDFLTCRRVFYVLLNAILNKD